MPRRSSTVSPTARGAEPALPRPLPSSTGRVAGGGRPHLSLRLEITLLVAALIAMAWIASIQDLIEWGRGYLAAADAREANLFVDRLLQAGQNLAFERGRANVLLAAEGPADEENLRFLADRRRAATERLEAALAEPRVAEAALVSRLRENYQSLRALRPEVDRALALPKTDRDPSLSGRWFGAASTLVEDLVRLTAQVSLDRNFYTSAFRIYSRLKISVLELRNSLGIEASRIAAAVSSGAPLGASARDEIMELRGRGLAEWSSIRRECGLVDNRAVTAAADVVDEDFFGRFRPLQDQALEDARLGRPYSLSAALLTEASVPALDSIARFMSVLTEESRAEIEGEALRLRQNYVLHLVLTLASLLVGILTAAIVQGRLLSPLWRLQGELAELTRGNTEVEIGRGSGTDELGRMQTAVLAFRDSLLERKRLEERLLAQSLTDPLTGVANRRRMDRALISEWQRAERHGWPLALVMMDVDWFKKYNDHYGHQEGDLCLKAIAGVLAGRAQREGDLVARYGGEEFTAILPGLQPAEAADWAEAARREVRALAIPHAEAEGGVVTISCGVAWLRPGMESSPDELLRRSDEALYRAKAGGRDRVAAWEEGDRPAGA